MKEAISVIASLLVFVSYVPYIRDTIKGKTKPHIFSWINAAVIVSILFAIQIIDGAGWGAFVTLSAALASVTIALLALKNGFDYVKKIDSVLIAFSGGALALWLIADQPALAATLLVSAQVFGFIPTIRKAWGKPHEETLFTWGLNGFRHTLAIFGLATISYTTAIFPVVWAVINVGFSSMIVMRRRALKA